ENGAVTGEQRFEDAVAGEQAVVERGHPGARLGHEIAVDPHVPHGRSLRLAPTAFRRPLVLSALVAAPLGAARPRRWPRRLLIGLNVFVAVCVVGTGVGYGYLRFRFGQIHKIPIPGLTQDDPGESMNVLLVG